MDENCNFWIRKKLMIENITKIMINIKNFIDNDFISFFILENP